MTQLSITETQDQIHYFKWLRTMYPNLVATISPASYKPGGTPLQQMIQRKKMKDMGYLAGTPDIMIFEPIKIYHGLIIELKRVGGKKPEAHQIDVLKRLAALKYSVWICYGYAEAIAVTTKYLKGDV